MRPDLSLNISHTVLLFSHVERDGKILSDHRQDGNEVPKIHRHFSQSNFYLLCYTFLPLYFYALLYITHTT